MRNYMLLFSFLLLFVVSDLDAQRSRRSSGRIDKTELNKSDKKGSKELYKAYGFESREEMKDFLLDQDLNRKDRRIVEKYGKGKGLSKGQNRRLEELLEEHRGKRASSETVTRSGRVSGDRALSSRGSSTSRAKSRGRSGRVSEDRALTGRGSSTSRAKSRGRSGRQESQNEGPSFDEIDTNNDGEISRDEARVFFGDEDDFDAKYDEVDADNSGSVDPQEYADANEGDQDGDHDWYCQICDMHFDSQEAMDDHANQMGHTNADFDCDPNGDYPQMDPGPDGGCSDYADCNGNGLFDVGEPCYEGDDQGPSFDEVDSNNDGEISYSEAQAVFGQEPDFDERFNDVDSDNSGSVDMAEWEAAGPGDDGDNDQNDGQ